MDPKQLVLDKIKENGGWVNTHAHLDRAYTLTEANFNNSYSYLKEKWHLVDEMKKAATVDQIYTRMAKATEVLLEQGTQAMGTFIDVDEQDQYGNNGMVTQKLSKEAQDAGQKGAILGNSKVFWSETPQPVAPSAPNFDEGVPESGNPF